MTIKVYLDRLMYSPFDFPEFRDKFRKEGIVIVKSVGLAHLIMSSYLVVLKKYANRFNKRRKYLLWTHEPYHDFTYTNEIKLKSGVVIGIMNCYTRDVFTHNHRYFYFRNFIDWQKVGRGKYSDQLVLDGKNRGIVALSTYYDKGYYEKNQRYTLLPKRYAVIEEGARRGMVDVHGKNWEKHQFVRALGNSRNDGDRRKSKEEILGGYRFNICLENTNFSHYVTEKIWEPIKYGCLPIYYANGTIYQSFSRGSFIDLREYEKECNGLEEGIKKMYDDLAAMTEGEFLERYIKCVQAFNRVIEDGNNNVVRRKSKNLNINYLEYDTCYHQMLKRIKSS